MPLTKDQAAYLNGRVVDHYGTIRYPKSNPMPAAVIAAKAKIKAWEEQIATANIARTIAVSRAKAEAVEAIVFGDPERAIAAVKKFETYKG